MHFRQLLAILSSGFGWFSPARRLFDAKLPQLRPLVILYVRNPWLVVIGSDSPRLALYDNGLVIYRSGRKYPEEAFLSAVLSLPELRELRESLDLERRLEGLGEWIDASKSTDRPTNELRYWANGQPRTISVYGNLREGAPDREHVPKPFLEAFDALTRFHAAGAKPWLPPLIEVMIWPVLVDYSRGKRPATPWPKGWPDLDDRSTRRRKNNSYSLFLQSKHFPDLLELLRSLGDEQIVLIGNREWSIEYRIPFPGGF